MRKERIKTAVLVFLIIMNFILGSRILIEKKLWPNGYNFFSNIDISRFFTNIRSYFTENDSYKTQALFPRKIIINTGDQTTRISLNSDDAHFGDIMNGANEILKPTFSQSSDSVIKIGKDEFFSSLTVDSVHLNFPDSISINVFSRLLGINGTAADDAMQKFTDIVLVYSPRSCVYMANISDNKYIKINSPKNGDDIASVVNETIKKYETEDNPIINYSFDLKFDKPFGSQKTTLNPLIGVYSKVLPQNIINAKNPLAEENGFMNEDIINGILRSFNINPNTMRRYTEAGGTMVFVENDAILKIDTDGYLEYNATSEENQLLSGGNEYDNILNLADLATVINKTSGNDCKLSFSEDSFDNVVLYSFDYIVSGIPVVIDTDKLRSGVEAETENGRLKKYKQYIRTYEQLSEKSAPREFLEALDSVIADYSESMNEIYIDKMYMGYTDNGVDGEKYADWIVKVDNVIVE